MKPEYIKSELKPLIEQLKHLEMRKKQDCIDLNIDAIERLRVAEKIKLSYLVSIINEESGLDIPAPVFRNMIYRSLKKNMPYTDGRPAITKQPPMAKEESKKPAKKPFTGEGAEPLKLPLSEWRRRTNIDMGEILARKLEEHGFTPETTLDLKIRGKSKLMRYIVTYEQQAKYKVKEPELPPEDTDTPQTYSDKEWNRIGARSPLLIELLNKLGLSPEEVKKWGCANEMQLIKQVTEYNMRKR